MTANVITLAGEGFILAVCRVSSIKFGTMKVVFDISLVLISCILSALFLHGIYGVREGTVAAAILVGTISRQINKCLEPMLMYGREAQSKTKTASPATIPKSGERNRKIHSCMLYLISI